MKYFIRKINLIVVFVKSTNNKSYIFSRFLSTVMRPLLLFICLTQGFKEIGTIIAMIFLVTTVNMTLCSIPIFRDFFINFNNKSALKKKYYKDKYKDEIVIFFFISLFFLIPLNQFFENNIEIFICSILIFIIDKVYEEIQRLLILKKRFDSWSTITNFKSVTLILLLLSPIANINIIYLVVVYFFLNIFNLYTYINLSFNLDIKNNLDINKKIKKFISSLWRNKKVYIMHYLLILDAIGDKIIIGKNFKEYLPEYIFLSNVLSMPITFLFYFYISRYKLEFVENTISFKDVILSKKFNSLLILTFGFAFAFVLFFVFMNYSGLSHLSIIFLSLIYIVRAYSLILEEIVYWKKFYQNFLLFETMFFLVLIICYSFIFLFNLPIEIFLFVLFTFLLTKLIFKIIIFSKKKIYIV
jgi:hypothetical protein